MTEDEPIPAGSFADWLSGMERALRGEAASDVPCGGCTACCTSSQFIHIDPDETGTRWRIPAALVFPAPGMPQGTLVMGYDEHGHCPMLINGACSIYEHRPRTCRTYDCRVFAAAGIGVDEEEKRAIAQRAERWRFEHPSEIDQVRHEAVRAAARFVAEHPDRLPEPVESPSATRRAVLAIRLHRQFLTD